MLTFEQFVVETFQRGECINTMFEEQFFGLVGALERVAVPLTYEGIPYELIGGGAVMVQVMQVEPSAVRLTKDVDIMIDRANLDRVKSVMAGQGFTFRHVAGLDMLLPPGATKALNAVHLIFSGELVKPSQVVPNPPVRPEHLSIHGVSVAVIPVADLVAMKLSSNRDIDRVHVRDLDSVGLVTFAVEQSLPARLMARLAEIRNTD